MFLFLIINFIIIIFLTFLKLKKINLLNLKKKVFKCCSTQEIVKLVKYSETLVQRLRQRVQVRLPDSRTGKSVNRDVIHAATLV